jgi:hypothetical protein
MKPQILKFYRFASDWMRVLAIILLIPRALSAAPKKKAVVEFFYTIPMEASPNEGWAYIVPECQPLTRTESAKLRKCVPMGAGHRSCSSSRMTTLENPIKKSKLKTSLVFQILSSRASCEADRGNYLSSDE